MGAALLTLLGLAVVAGGAEFVVRGSSHLADRFGVPPAITGLTIVAIGTSAPEMAVGIDGALKGHDSLVVGNIAGTNTVNLLLILGLAALLEPLAIRRETLRLDLPFMIVAALALVAFSLDGTLNRLESFLLLAIGIVYTIVIVQSLRRIRRRRRRGRSGDLGEERPETASGLAASVFLGLGIVLVVLGATWLVDGASDLAGSFGVSEGFIGLTVVAIGTSAPELVMAIVATLRRARDVAVGNLIGSSVYNIAAVLAAAGLVVPGGLEIDDDLVRFDLPVMTVAVLLCAPVFASGRVVSRMEGGLFVAGYCGYLAYLLVARSGPPM